jgi:heavy metal translocating P-type ATPase
VRTGDDRSATTADAGPALCRLCGTRLRDPRAGERGFCCEGCSRVHEVLAQLPEAEHAAYVAAAQRLGLVPTEGGGVAPASPQSALPSDPAAEKEERFRIAGLWCPSCSWVAEQILCSQRGVRAAQVDFFTSTAAVRYDLRCASPAALRELLSPLGYQLESLGEPQRDRASRAATLSFVACAVITMNLMSLATVRYFERLGVLDTVPPVLGWVELALTLPVLWIGYRPMVRRAWAGLRHGAANMDLLLAIGVTAAFVLSGAALVLGRPDIYFETCAGLVTIQLLGRMVEARLRDRAAAELTRLLRMPITRVRRLNAAGDVEFAELGAVSLGDRLRFEVGDLVPVDGTLDSERALLSEAVLTGEPAPVGKVRWSAVIAGSTVVDAPIELCVTRSYEHTRLCQVAAAVGQALRQAEGRLRSADRVSAVFVPVVLLGALGVWLARWWLGGWALAASPDGWFPSVAVLAVACPCAFSLAGIAAITAATGHLLQRGILVREPTQLEDLHRVRHLLLDKTGTVTRATMQVERLAWRERPHPELLASVLGAEQGSRHPVAEAIVAYLRAELSAADQIRARVDADGDASMAVPRAVPGVGRRLALPEGELGVGSARLFREPFSPPELAARHTAVWFGLGATAEGCFLLSDTLSPEAAGAADALRRSGLVLELVSGDRQATTEWAARELGVATARGDLSLDDKLALVRAHRAAGREIGFVGDGTNDALAMSEATVSIAVARATDQALAASGFVLLGGRLDALPTLFAVGRKLRRVVAQNTLWAFAFNVAFVPVAAAGRLVPLAAMALMLLSSSAVLLSSLRMSRGA